MMIRIPGGRADPNDEERVLGQVNELSPSYGAVTAVSAHGESITHKRTELGVIPHDWEVVPLRQVAQVRSGIAKNSKKQVQNPVAVHYLRVANVQDGFLDLTDMSTIRVSQADLPQFTVLPGDVLMNEGGDLDKLGRGAMWRGEYDPCVHQNHVFVVRCGKKLLPDYLNIWTGTPQARRYFLVAGKQTTNLASINKTALGMLPVLMPTRDEQRAIAEALSDVDGLLGALDALIAKKRAIKQAAMQQLLTGKTRLPGFGGAWATKRLGAVAPFQRGFDLPNPEIKLGSFPVVYSNGILTRHAAYQVEGPGVVTGRSGTIGKVTFVKENYWPHNTALWVTNFHGNDPKFVFYFYVNLGLERLASGSGVPTLNRNDVHAIEVLIPATKDEQIAIATVLSDMDIEIAALENRREKTRAIKQGMMQQLLTGRVRLVKPKEVANA